MKTDIRSEGSRIELDDPLADGRQSETALKVWRGAARLMRQRKFACAAEVTLASARRADLLALGPKHELWIIEVKSSVADFREPTTNGRTIVNTATGSSSQPIQMSRWTSFLKKLV
jgi:hypothetical protein